MAASLQQSQIAHYLLGLGLVNPRAVVEGDLTVIDRSQRNTVHVVTALGEPLHVVKQAGPESAATLAYEAAVLRALARIPSLAERVPVVVHFDPATVRLVLRSPAAAVAWRALARVPRLAAGALGRTLATLHGARPELDAPAPEVERLPSLTLPEPALERVRDMSDGALELLALVQGSPELCERLRRIGEETGHDGFVHGDLRWDNCLVVPPHGSRRNTRVLLIDWELAGRGDPAADLGVAFAEHLRAWLTSIPIPVPSDPGRYEGHARQPLARLQPAMRALWDGYRRISEHPPPLRRVTELAGVRLLDAAMEYAQSLTRANAEARLMLQVGANVLRDDTAAALLGLRE